MELTVKHKNDNINKLITEYFQSFHSFEGGRFFYKAEVATEEKRLELLKKFKELDYHYSWRDSTCYQTVIYNKKDFCFISNFEGDFILHFFDTYEKFSYELASNGLIDGGVYLFDKIKRMYHYKYKL